MDHNKINGLGRSNAKTNKGPQVFRFLSSVIPFVELLDKSPNEMYLS